MQLNTQQKMTNKIIKNREKLDGVYNLDEFLFLNLMLSDKLRLNEIQLKMRFKFIYNIYCSRINIILNIFNSFRNLFEEQRFGLYVKIGIYDYYNELKDVLKNKDVLAYMKYFCDEFYKSLEQNKVYDYSNFISYINMLEIKYKLSKKILKKF